MITGLMDQEIDVLTQRFRCGDCDSRLVKAWGGAFGVSEYVVRCGRDPSHETTRRVRYTRDLYDGETKTWREFDMATQRPVNEPRELALPSNQDGMLARLEEAEKGGVFPQDMSREQRMVLARIALAYGLDPLMQELMYFQGKPYITIQGRRRLDANVGHHPSIRFRPLTAEERQMYMEADALKEGDLAGVCILTTEHSSVIEGFGKVARDEREALTDKNRRRSPVVAANPIEMWQKRAETRARNMAYGPAAILHHPEAAQVEPVYEDMGDLPAVEAPAQESGADQEKEEIIQAIQSVMCGKNIEAATVTARIKQAYGKERARELTGEELRGLKAWVDGDQQDSKQEQLEI